MKATIVYDNISLREGLIADWGFACYIETRSKKILFDTGGASAILLYNMKKLGIEPSAISDIFISHDHFDHIGGLSGLLDKNPNATLYLPDYLRGANYNKKSIFIDNAQKLDKNLYTTGVLENIEQSLIIKTEKGLLLFVGCSHPHMTIILNAASQFGNIYAIIGGLHNFNKYELFKDLKLICPTHCTQHKTEIIAIYPEKQIKGGVGKIIEI